MYIHTRKCPEFWNQAMHTLFTHSSFLHYILHWRPYSWHGITLILASWSRGFPLMSASKHNLNLGGVEHSHSQNVLPYLYLHKQWNTMSTATDEQEMEDKCHEVSFSKTFFFADKQMMPNKEKISGQPFYLLLYYDKVHVSFLLFFTQNWFEF